MQETNQQSTGLRTSLAVSLYTSATEQQEMTYNTWSVVTRQPIRGPKIHIKTMVLNSKLIHITRKATDTVDW